MAKTVLITGAAVRLGAHMALSMADEGWDVVIHYRNSRKDAEGLAKKIRALGRKAHLAHVHLEDAHAVEGFIPSLSKQGIQLDCLINNAALFQKDNLRQLNHELWQTHMQVNFYAPLQLTRAFVAQYKGKNGNVINITDGIVGWSLSANFLSYSLSKLGLSNATQMLARELAPRIRVNEIAPGATLEGVQDKKDTFARLAKKIPLGRVSSPLEICDAVHYILSAPSFTGQIISLAGGLQHSPAWDV